MSYFHTAQGVAYNPDTQTTHVLGTWTWQEVQDWISAGNTLLPMPEEPQPDPFQVATDAMQAKLDDAARSLGYDTIYTAVGYVGDPNQKFNNEAVALRNWRSECWVYAGQKKADVNAGSIPMPTLDEFMAGAPVFTPPIV